MEQVKIADAIRSLRPASQWNISGESFEGIEWLDNNQTCPTQEEIDTEISRLTLTRLANQYQRQRAAEYPPITDYLDGVVKGDQAQIDKYIADCLAVKAKYPKETP